MPSQEKVRVGGTWLDDLAPWGDLSYSSRWGDGGGGCDEASWSVSLSPYSRPKVLTRGALVEVMVGSSRVWVGTLAAPDWSAGSFTADGLFAEGSKFLALNGSGNSTAAADTAVDRAIADGLRWTRPNSLSSAAVSSTTNNLNRVSDLLDQTADRDGKRWGVFEDGAVIMAADSTTVAWQLAPGVVSLGEQDSDYASALKIRYLDSGTSTYQTVSAVDAAAANVYGYREDGVDLTPLGAISPVAAAIYGNSILAKGRARLGWANDVTIGRYELTNMGGAPASLSMVRAGQVVRVHGAYDPLGVTPYRDVVLGKVSYAPDAGTVTMAPVDTQPQTLAEATEAVMRRASRRTFVA